MFVSKVLEHSNEAEELAYLDETIAMLEEAHARSDPTHKIEAALERLRAQRKALEPRLVSNGQSGIFV
jgi:hypothetical protein